MPRRLIMLSLLAALSALSTGCCGRIRQCIANRWNALHPYGLHHGGCCAPAYKVGIYPGPIGCTNCGHAGEVIYQPPIAAPGAAPSIGSPMPLPGPSVVPSHMPPKN